MISTAIIDALVAAGCSAEQVAAAVKADMAAHEVAIEAKRAKERERKRLRLPDREWWPLRARVLMRDGYQCAYCESITGPWTADHVVPVCRGGSNEEDNLVACCVPCNLSKGSKLVSEWEGRE
jgi:5-methylcytosine-specific restriction endonuclease McrA